MNINDPVYLVISCRKTTDTDVETDFIINDQHYLIQAIERVNLDGMIDAESKLRSKFPKNLILSTYSITKYARYLHKKNGFRVTDCCRWRFGTCEEKHRSNC